MSYSVLDIQTLTNCRIQGFHLDTPTQDLIDSSDQLLLTGWVASPDDPISYLEIRDSCGDASCCIHTFSLNVERPDVVSHLSNCTINQRCGFTTYLTVLGLADNCLLPLNAHTASGEKITLCKIRLNRTPTSTHFNPKIHPIIITTIGRTGSTLLMQLLAKHPSITVANQHPYETFALEYWLHIVSNQLYSPHTFLSPIDQQRFERDFMSDAQRRTWFQEKYYTMGLHFCQQAIEDYYHQICIQQNAHKASYFAEKIPYFAGTGTTTWRQLSLVVRELYPDAREIVLVRDFRDMVLSALHFGARENTSRDLESEKATAYLNVTNEVSEFSQYYKCHQNNTLLVRYEDLILDTSSTLKAIFTYLSISDSDDIVDAIAHHPPQIDQSHQQHITSKSILNSIQRWKQELIPQLQDKYTDAFRDNLNLFGYDA
ncbi:MAG: sulfotransferase [Candidatus Thiodiazotropha sp. (ex Troendleina suluensis)]|nr:sulfotransferase [Candidatus Thiodiazotropha sp. (ex Troendleina suluensis)]